MKRSSLVILVLAAGCSHKAGGGGGSDMAMKGGGGGDMAMTTATGDMTGQAPPDMTTAGTHYDWLQFGFDEQHSGNNPRETTITKANVAMLALKQQHAFSHMIDGAPVYLEQVATVNGTQDLVFVATTAGELYALDAKTLAQVWMKAHGPTGGTCKSSNGGDCYSTSSPAIDPNRMFVYIYGLDGYVHKHAVGDGSETTTGGWPELATAKPNLEKGGSALAVANARNGRFLYVANGGYYGDAGDYQGHVTAVNLGDGSQKVFNTLCSNKLIHFTTTAASDCTAATESAVWSRPGVLYRPDADRIYFATGNGAYNAATYLWGDSVLAIAADGSGTATGPLDAWTPTDQMALQSADADVGSTGPALLPVPAGSKYPHIALQGNKTPQGTNAAPIRLLDLDNLSGMGGPGHLGGELFSMAVPQGDEILTQPAVWVNPADASTWVFIANDSGISALKLVPDGGTGKPSLVKVWQHAEGGTSPIVANGILYYVGNASGSGGANIVYAIDPASADNMGDVLWMGTISPLSGATAVGGIHWESPIVAHGTLYISSEHGNTMPGVADGKGYLSAFTLP